ncbi:MAG: bifunctional oligoribonuclease/PAP phosphatase NrnA [Deltaproteobacteria bacterium]|nr:bifunctional oligoribonuclease/PAP phosphatase NrnA [Deltaproteobacteria bacterium]MBW2051959.1 bifunctional oligoribonuclease/PAP phosphatase NrnA [Deltaproteobacteria bacterium]MBW2140495.1 bifunctional oligoribonuclease/PAP phosphatase NrnA [Deltaproteobacteria bacterium]MBW2322348.1 bifunctional oligoribonuclease/PAP phosphatase NrnA [Deltaproteobacteria bacterium]
MRNEPNQNQAGIESLADLLRKKNHFLLLSHVSPDGDALGSMIALGDALRSLGKNVKLFNETGVPSRYSFLPRAAEVTGRLGRLADFEVAILLDCHSLKRAGVRFSQTDQLPLLAVLDHHEVGDPVSAAVTVIDPQTAATGELVYQLLITMGVSITPEMATNLYTAISTDTGSFNFDNTTASCLEVAAALVDSGARPWDIYRQLNFNLPPERLRILSQTLGGVDYYYKGQLGTLTIDSEIMSAAQIYEIDTEDFVSFPRSIKGVELAVLITENGGGVCHVSLRSQGRVNAAAMAKSFGGGGHRNAAGFSISGSAESVKSRVIAAAASFMPREEDRSLYEAEP